MSHRRLDPLLDRARSREEAVARELASLARDLSAHEQRLAELKNYAEEYTAPAAGSVDPAALLNRLAFRERIDAALARQASTVESSRQRCEHERARLLLASRDTKVLENLAASYQREAECQERRKEQKQLDELAGRSALLRRRIEEQT